MNMDQTKQQSLRIGREQLLAFVGAMIDGGRGREDNDHTLPHGPWDPVIRAALERMTVFGPEPDPWKGEIFGPQSQPWRAAESMFGELPGHWKIVFATLAARHPAI